MKKLLFVLVLLTLLYPVTAFADFGPKSSIDIYVKNAPPRTGAYYLDLLTTYQNDMDAEYDPETYNEDMYRLLWDYEEDGYRATMTHMIDVNGATRGGYEGRSKNGYRLHDLIFPPSEFKIIIVTSQGDVRVSQVYHKIKFYDTVYLDFETMEITPAGGSFLLDWLLQFLKTFSLTILIEGVILLLFGFKLKYNWKPFLLVNLCTQVFLIITSGLLLIFLNLFYIFIFLLIEVIIIDAERKAYEKYLIREKAGGRTAYAVTANIISCCFRSSLYCSITFQK